MKTVDIVDLGATDYASCLEIQRDTFHARRRGECNDTMFLTRHHHVFTIGKTGNNDHLLAGEAELRAAGAQVFQTDRGGDITYHGPGQLVGYPILDLTGYYLDVHRYLRDLEEVLIRTVGDFGVRGYREPEYTGVWALGEKIAAIGVRLGSWITMHGFALNVNTDLSFFDRIIPCGITHKGVTSLEKCTGRKVPLRDVADSAVRHFADVFSVAPRAVATRQFMHKRQQTLIDT